MGDHMSSLECTEGTIDNRIPGLTKENDAPFMSFVELTPQKDVLPETIASALTAFSPDKPETMKSFFELFDSIPLAELKGLKDEKDPFEDIYALMRRRTKELNKNYTVTKLSQQLAPFIQGKETGIAPETKKQFLKVAVASCAVESGDENVKVAAV
jgi:hypothetical protein